MKHDCTYIRWYVIMQRLLTPTTSRKVRLCGKNVSHKIYRQNNVTPQRTQWVQSLKFALSKNQVNQTSISNLRGLKLMDTRSRTGGVMFSPWRDLSYLLLKLLILQTFSDRKSKRKQNQKITSWWKIICGALQICKLIHDHVYKYILRHGLHNVKNISLKIIFESPRFS